MTCWGCTAAEANPSTGCYVSTCIECQARDLSGGPEFAASLKFKRLSPEYIARLKGIAGDDWESLHQKAKKWGMKRGIL